MKRTATAVSMSLALMPCAAFAQDWTIKATQSETVELNSNQFLETSPAGSLGSYSTLSVNAEARTSTSKFDFDADGTYRKYWGPGAADTSQSESTNWGFRAHYELIGKNGFDREYVETIWRQQSAAYALLNDLGFTTPVSGALDRLTTTGGVDRALSALDTLSLLATSTMISYEPASAGTALTDTLAHGVWRHNLNQSTALTTTSEAEFLDFNNAFNTKITILRNQMGVQANLSPVLSFNGEAGAAYLITNGGVETPAFGGLPLATSSTNLDWIGDALLTYKFLKDTTFTFNASQSIGPSVVGSLFKRDTIGVGLARTINSHSTLSFSTYFNRSISTNTTDFVSVSTTYSYTPIKDWTAQLTYRYLHRFSASGPVTIDPITNTPTSAGTGPADSHSIIAVLSHSLTVLPPGN